MNVYGFIDKNGKINMRGRIPKEKEQLAPFKLAQKILIDTKNILSCEVIKVEEKNIYIAHIELQPYSKKDIAYTIYHANLRCKELINSVNAEIYYRIRTNEESFPLTGSGKRSVQALKAEGITDKCFKPIYENKCYSLIKFH